MARSHRVQVAYWPLVTVTGGWCDHCQFPSLVCGVFLLEIAGRPREIHRRVWCDDCRRELPWTPDVTDGW
jgi:hypothetical protein